MRSYCSHTSAAGPYAYLVHVLTELPQRAPDADIIDLSPINFVNLMGAARGPA